MKTKYPSMFGILAVLMLVISLIIPANLVNPTKVEADPGICKWDVLMTPEYLAGKNDVLMPNDIWDLAVGPNGLVQIASVWAFQPPPVNAFVRALYYTNNAGIGWTTSKYNALLREPGWVIGNNVYSVAIAPDDANFIAITTDNGTGPAPGVFGPQEVWVSTNGGSAWNRTNLDALLWPLETIRDLDVSMNYGGRRDIAVCTADGVGNGRIFVVKSGGFGGWLDQSVLPSLLPTAFGNADYFAIKFSPTYNGDAALVTVFATNGAEPIIPNATIYNIGLRDIDNNTTPTYAFATPGIEVKDPAMGASTSPGFNWLEKADLELPSDFAGQAASLRRAYISTDAFSAKQIAVPNETGDGIFRIDDNVVYTLMNTGTIVNKSIYSIAYFGTYASGKLLAGERMGFPCSATVPTWFTDSPTTCPIPCWYPALKPTTGAANQGVCLPNAQDGVGAAIVEWGGFGQLDGTLAIAATGSANITLMGLWWVPFWVGPAFTIRDESAYAISRNNGETWNQLSLIDTRIDWFNDIQFTPNCMTSYLASASGNNTLARCDEFDSVWRSSSDPKVVSPLPPLPVGTIWERVFTHVTAPDCTDNQTNLPLLRIVPYCSDPEGQIVAWGVHDPAVPLSMFAHGVAAWSPDFGDYWAMITPRNPIQDFTFESSTILYFLSPNGLVQKMPYTGTAWSTALPDADSLLPGFHTIAAYPEGKVLTGVSAFAHGLTGYAACYCGNFNTDNPEFAPLVMSGPTADRGDVHVAFDTNFKDNNIIFINDEQWAPAGPTFWNLWVGVGGLGSVYRNNIAAPVRFEDWNMMDPSNGAVGCNAPHPVAQTGLVLAFTGEALYSSHAVAFPSCNSGVCRTIDDGTGRFGPLSGMPKPGIAWDCLDTFSPANTCNVTFTLQPTALRICGCCDLTTDSTLWALDNENWGFRGAPVWWPGYNPAIRKGMPWGFTDCLAKRGPSLITEDKTLIGCDPVSGRAQEVNLCWEQLCVSDRYDIEISKVDDFSILVIDWTLERVCGGFTPTDVTTPCAFIPAGGRAAPYEGSAIAQWGNLECGHTYWWRVKARSCATGQWVRSPWSEVRSFIIKAGLPVTTPYYGPQLLAPNNGCLGCPVSPVSFSWSPFKETTKYKFQLAKDAAMTQIVKEEAVTTTAYEYDGALDYSGNYFWRVMALEPAPSDWSAVFSFQTEAAPPPPPEPAGPAPTPMWVWVVIAIGAILVIVTLVLIFKTRRV